MTGAILHKAEYNVTEDVFRYEGVDIHQVSSQELHIVEGGLHTFDFAGIDFKSFTSFTAYASLFLISESTKI